MREAIRQMREAIRQLACEHTGLTTRGRRRRVRLAQIDVAREVGVEGVGIDEESVGGWREAHEDVER
jgi:hypothetical protein